MHMCKLMWIQVKSTHETHSAACIRVYIEVYSEHIRGVVYIFVRIQLLYQYI